MDIEKRKKIIKNQKSWKLATVLMFLYLGGMILFIFLLKHHQEETDKVYPEYVFTYAENQSGDYPTTQGARYFADLVEKRSGGRIRILIYPAAELGDEDSAVEQVIDGGIDFTRASLATIVSYNPRSIVLMMPYIYNSREHMWRVLSGKTGDNVLRSFDGTGMHAMSWYDAGVRNFYTVDKPIRGIDDLRNMSIRVQASNLNRDMIRALGATPVTVVYADVYSALETGTIDGAENNWASYVSMHHSRVARYCTLDEHMRIPEIQMMSETSYRRLSPEDQALIDQASRESAEYEKELWQRRENSSREKAEKDGVEIIKLSDKEKIRFRKAMEPLYRKYCGDYMDLMTEVVSAGM